MIKLLIVTFALLIVVTTSPIDSLLDVQPAQIVAINYRLNDDVIPSHYKLEFTPYFEKVNYLKFLNSFLNFFNSN